MNAGENFIQVKPGKKVVKLINLGGSPFHMDKKSNAIIPNNLQVETYYQKFNLIATTRVTLSQDSNFTIAEYQFKTETVEGGWFLNPSRALKDFVMKAGGEWKPSTDGRLIFGVTYPPIQKLVREKFSQQLASLLANKVESSTPAKPGPPVPSSMFQVTPVIKSPLPRLHHQTINDDNRYEHEFLPLVKRPRIIPKVVTSTNSNDDDTTPSAVDETNSGMCRLLEAIAKEDQLAISLMMASPL